MSTSNGHGTAKVWPNKAKAQKPRITLETRKAIFALRAQGVTNGEIGDRLGIHSTTVSKIFSAARKAEAAGRVRAQETERQDAGAVAPVSDEDVLRDWRGRLRKKSVRALDRGLDHDADPYKAGALGRDVLKGLGELQGDVSVNFTVQTMISAIPEDWRDEYLIVTPAIDAETDPASDDLVHMPAEDSE